jgi:flagellar protein FlaG
MNISDTLNASLDVKSAVQPAPSPPPSQEAQPTEKKEASNQIGIDRHENDNEESLAPKLSMEETEELVEALEDLAKTIQTKLNFSINETTNDIVVKIIDKESETVIKQFPSEELLELQEKMIDLSGFLFNRNV